MWVRKRLDIGWSDLALLALRCLLPANRTAIQQSLESSWAAEQTLACLSVRSGFDLLWQSLALPRGSEVLFSSVTIPDMARIAEHHGLVPVPVDLDAETMAPNLDRLREAISPATRAIVVAHLFGGRIAMPPIHEIARRHKLLVIEDCAQAFDGGCYKGHPESDASMFSFGPIKTATVLAGGLMRVRDRELLARMRELQAAYPVQKRSTLLKRLAKYSVLKFFSNRWLYAGLVAGCRLTGRNYDLMVNGAVRGFAGPAFFDRIRQQPSAPLMALLARRLERYPAERLARRTAKGQLLVRMLEGNLECPSAALSPHSHWVFAILSDDPTATIARLCRSGFDATQGQSMCVVAAPPGRAETEATAAKQILSRMVFVPIYPEIPDRELERMAEILLESGVKEEPARTHRPAQHVDQHQAVR